MDSVNSRLSFFRWQKLFWWLYLVFYCIFFFFWIWGFSCLSLQEPDGGRDFPRLRWQWWSLESSVRKTDTRAGLCLSACEHRPCSSFFRPYFLHRCLSSSVHTYWKPWARLYHIYRKCSTWGILVHGNFKNFVFDMYVANILDMMLFFYICDFGSSIPVKHLLVWLMNSQMKTSYSCVKEATQAQFPFQIPHISVNYTAKMAFEVTDPFLGNSFLNYRMFS